VPSPEYVFAMDHAASFCALTLTAAMHSARTGMSAENFMLQ
jgi:hypothetical protein